MSRRQLRWLAHQRRDVMSGGERVVQEHASDASRGAEECDLHDRRRLAVMRTSMLSFLGFRKSRRIRPSGIDETVAGMELPVTYQPDGSTTAFAGRPNDRSQMS